jgi:hypothetical protein
MPQAVCAFCGTSLGVAAPGVFARAKVVGALCPRCWDQQVLDSGGAIMALTQDFPGARFQLGKVMITPGAIKALAESFEHAAPFLDRHVRGDWGTFGQVDQIELTEDERRRG